VTEIDPAAKHIDWCIVAADRQRIQQFDGHPRARTASQRARIWRVSRDAAPVGMLQRGKDASGALKKTLFALDF